MRDRGDVPNDADGETRCLQRPQGGFSTSTRAFDLHLNGTHASVSRFPRRTFRSYLSGKRSAFSRSLEADSACTRPSHNVPLWVGDCHDGVVERRVDVHNAFGNSFFDFLLPRRAAFTRFRHIVLLVPSLLCRRLLLTSHRTAWPFTCS